jgi:PAS domain S-box-containing protein
MTRSLAKREDFRTIIDHLDGVTIWLVSEPGEFEYISDGFEDIWGISSDEIEDDPSRLLESIHPDDRETVASAIRQSKEGDVPEASYEARIVRPDGEIRWGLTRQFPIRDDDDDLVRIVGVTTDITTEKRREQELEALNRIIRHDIRNDMSVVLGWAEMLETRVDDTEAEPLQHILTAGHHVVELTEIARDYAETVVSEKAVEPNPVSLRSVLEAEIALRRDTYPSAEFEIVGEIPGVDVMANDMVGSVFRNLLNNAVQHNDKDVPIVEIECDVHETETIIRIADNGPGVADAQKERIFEKEQKGIGSSGTGMGLYLVQTLVDGYGGDVQLADNEPTGCVFTVRLPNAN